jgi:hypothetical protein
MLDNMLRMGPIERLTLLAAAIGLILMGSAWQFGNGYDFGRAALFFVLVGVAHVYVRERRLRFVKELQAEAERHLRAFRDYTPPPKIVAKPPDLGASGKGPSGPKNPD